MPSLFDFLAPLLEIDFFGRLGRAKHQRPSASSEEMSKALNPSEQSRKAHNITVESPFYELAKGAAKLSFAQRAASEEKRKRNCVGTGLLLKKRLHYP